MTRVAAKLGFIHRRLWQRNITYRAAFLVGPPPFIGVAVATAVWFAIQSVNGHAPFGPAAQGVGSGLPWAHYVATFPGRSSAAIAANPDAKLSDANADGTLKGLTAGWQVELLPITVRPAEGVEVLPTPLGGVLLDQPDLEVDRVMDAAPPGRLFIAAGDTSLVVITPGRYLISVQLSRHADRSADCILRFGLAHRRLISDVYLGASGAVTRTTEPIKFDLQPGLYKIFLGVGCWNGQQAVGQTRATLLIQRPGDIAASPAKADEILRPAPSY